MLGTGGVGKTTIAAALGLAAAQKGLKTALITVDPARRLREALGLQRLSAQPARLDQRRLRAAGLDSSLPLSAMMLDVKLLWDGLVEALVRSREARRQILENPFYRSMSQQFAGAEAYAALEQLDQLHRSARFDIHIVDTPPAAHAFEFFETPRHLIRLLDSPGARWLFTPDASPGRSALTVASRAARFVISQLESFTGPSTLSAISDFFGLVGEATLALSDRFHKTDALMHSEAVNFVLVTTPREDHLHHALELTTLTQRHNFRLRAIVLNRMLDEHGLHALRSSRRQMPAYLDEIARVRDLLGEDDSKAESVIDYLEHYRKRQINQVELAAHFAQELAPEIALAVIPALEPAVRDLPSLASLAKYLTESTGGRKFLENAAVAFAINSKMEKEAKRRFTG